jgi:hypothetical protein
MGLLIAVFTCFAVWCSLVIYWMSLCGCVVSTFCVSSSAVEVLEVSKYLLLISWRLLSSRLLRFIVANVERKTPIRESG